MQQHEKLNGVMEPGNHFKNGANPKSLMSRIIILSFIISFIGMIKISAQDEVELGIKAGLNTSNAVSNDKSREGESISGFNAGIFVDIPLKKIMPNLYLQPGLSMASKSIGSQMGDEWDETWSTYYLEMPILVSYRYPLSDKLKVYADFGPYFSYTFDDNGGTSSVYIDGIAYSQECYNSLFDAGLVFGAGIKFKRFSLGLQYDLGLANVLNLVEIDSEYPVDNIYIKTRTLSVNVAYTFSNNGFRSIGRAFSNINTDADENGIKKNQIGIYVGVPLQKGASSMSLGLRNTHNFSNSIGWVIDLGGSLASKQQPDGTYENFFGVQGATGIKATTQPLLGELGFYGMPQIGYGYSFDSNSGVLDYGLEAGLEAMHKFNLGVCYGIKGGSWGLRLGYNF